MPLTTYSLTTLSDANQYLGFTTGDDGARDSFIINLINRSSSTIENYCERKFLSRKYRLERYDGDGEEYLFLEQRPIRGINTISLGTKVALTVECDATDAVHASIDITSDRVTINQIGGTPTGSSDVLFSTYLTVSAVAAKIAGYAGWDVDVTTGEGSHLSSDLLDVYGVYCLDQTVDLELPNVPINDFTVYKEGGKQLGIVYRNVGWNEGSLNVIITYTAGYATTPYDVQQACLQMVATTYNQSKRDLGLKSETLGDYEYTIANGSTSQNPLFAGGVTDLLSPWKKMWCV